MIRAMNLKYRLNVYYYTELHLLSIHGGTFFQPMYFEFPNDPKAYMDTHNNIMLGQGLKASIFLGEPPTSTIPTAQYDFYFPSDNAIQKTVWCSLILNTGSDRCVEGDSTHQLQQDKYDPFDLAIRSGHIIPLTGLDDYTDNNLEIKSTADVYLIPIDFHINP